jgi:hypothetical protein
LEWQENTQAIGKKYGVTTLLMKRYCNIPQAKPVNSIIWMGRSENQHLK